MAYQGPPPGGGGYYTPVPPPQPYYGPAPPPGYRRPWRRNFRGGGGGNRWQRGQNRRGNGRGNGNGNNGGNGNNQNQQNNQNQNNNTKQKNQQNANGNNNGNKQQSKAEKSREILAKAAELMSGGKTMTVDEIKGFLDAGQSPPFQPMYPSCNIPTNASTNISKKMHMKAENWYKNTVMVFEVVNGKKSADTYFIVKGRSAGKTGPIPNKLTPNFNAYVIDEAEFKTLSPVLEKRVGVALFDPNTPRMKDGSPQQHAAVVEYVDAETKKMCETGKAPVSFLATIQDLTKISVRKSGKTEKKVKDPNHIAPAYGNINRSAEAFKIGSSAKPIRTQGLGEKFAQRDPSTVDESNWMPGQPVLDALVNLASAGVDVNPSPMFVESEVAARKQLLEQWDQMETKMKVAAKASNSDLLDFPVPSGHSSSSEA